MSDLCFQELFCHFLSLHTAVMTLQKAFCYMQVIRKQLYGAVQNLITHFFIVHIITVSHTVPSSPASLVLPLTSNAPITIYARLQNNATKKI